MNRTKAGREMGWMSLVVGGRGGVSSLLTAFAMVVALRVPTPAHAEEHYFDSAGVKIRYTDEGSGPPVVLIHGYLASGDLNWRTSAVVSLLAKDFRVITLDNRGHGKSDKPTSPDDYGVNMVQDVLRLLDHLKIAKAHFVGYSMGGMITMKLATLAPDRMLSAVVGGMGWIKKGAAIGDRGDRRGVSTPLRACARAFPMLGITREELVAIKVPATVVIGTDDGLLGRSVEPLREVRPDIPVVLVSGANHLNCIFRPEFRKAIKEFLDKQVAASSGARQGGK